MNFRRNFFLKISNTNESPELSNMDKWRAVLNENGDIAAALPKLVEEFRRHLESPVDWNKISNDIIARKDLKAAQTLVKLVPDVDPDLPSKISIDEVSDEQKDINHILNVLNSSSESEINNLLPNLVNQYKNVIKDWKSIIESLTDSKNFDALVILHKLIPETVNLNFIFVVLSYLGTEKHIINFLKRYSLPSEDGFWLKKLLSKLDKSELTANDLLDILSIQENKEAVQESGYSHFKQNKNPEFLKVFLVNPPNNWKYYTQDIMNANDNLVSLFWHTLYSVIDTNTIISAIKNSIAYTDSAFILFDIIKNKLDRKKIITDVIEIIINNNFSNEFIKILTEDEINFLVENIFSLNYNAKFIISLYNDRRCNKNKFIGEMIKEKKFHIATMLVRSPEISKEDIDIVMIQRFIETSGESSLIENLLNNLEARNKKFNFPSAKKKYNELYKKTFIKAPDDEGNILQEYLKNKLLNWNKYTESFITEVHNKKDWFFLNEETIQTLFNNSVIINYLTVKNKQGKDVYHEIKNDNLLLLKCKNIENNIENYIYEWNEIVTPDFESKIINTSTNFGQLIKILERIISSLEMSHNFGLPATICKLCVLNPLIDLDDSNTQDFLELYNELNKTNTNQLTAKLDSIEKSNSTLINRDDFNKNLSVFNTLKSNFESGKSISMKRGSPEYESFKKLHTQINLITQFETIKQYIDETKPKDPQLYKFDWIHPVGLEFSVLKYLDPYAFQVGADTDCCQRIGGVGQDAAIDSFINPLAGVLIVKYQSALISQSYFHFVPEDNGLILDNVESNTKNMSYFGLDMMSLSRVYSDFAAAMKAKYPEISYIKCGMNYNKIDNSLFEKSSIKEDPRSFEVDDPYSDFDTSEHLDLLQPTKDINHISVSITKSKSANLITPLLRTGFVRTMFLKKLFGV